MAVQNRVYGLFTIALLPVLCYSGLMFKFLSLKEDNTEAVKAKYGIPNEISLSIETTPDGWFIVTSKELPGLMTQARDAKELMEMVNDAILTYFNVPRREASEVFNKIFIEGHGVILSERMQRELATS